MDTKRGILCHISPRRERKTPDWNLWTFFSLPCSISGRRLPWEGRKSFIFLWRTVLRDNGLWNIGQLEDCEFFFSLAKRYTVICFDIFSRYVWTLTRVEVGSLSKVQKSAGFNAAPVYTQCLFCGVFVHFVNLSGCLRDVNIGSHPLLSLKASSICFYPSVVHILSWFFIIFYHIVLFFTHIYF